MSAVKKAYLYFQKRKEVNRSCSFLKWVYSIKYPCWYSWRVLKQIVICMGSCLNDAGTSSSAFSQLTMDLNKNIVLQLEKAVCHFKSTSPPPQNPRRKKKKKSKTKHFFFFFFKIRQVLRVEFSLKGVASNINAKKSSRQQNRHAQNSFKQLQATHLWHNQHPWGTPLSHKPIFSVKLMPSVFVNVTHSTNQW